MPFDPSNPFYTSNFSLEIDVKIDWFKQLCMIFVTMDHKIDDYTPEKYWSEVAEQVNLRKVGNVVAGDDEPYYIYKREKFLNLFHQLSFSGKSIMELGSGPGGNLALLEEKGARRLVGVDISQKMIDLARRRLKPSTELYKSDGKIVPLEDALFDMVYSVTVLQHITDELMLKSVTSEMARVSRDEVILFERIEKTIKGHESNCGRPVDYYDSLFSEYGFTLNHKKTIQIGVSRRMSAITRQWMNSSSRKEGQPLSPFSIGVQRFLLPITKIMDGIFPTNTDLTMLRFSKNK